MFLTSYKIKINFSPQTPTHSWSCLPPPPRLKTLLQNHHLVAVSPPIVGGPSANYLSFSAASIHGLHFLRLSILYRFFFGLIFTVDFICIWSPISVQSHVGMMYFVCLNAEFFLICTRVSVWLRMGWKAAQKLIRNWKILRGDNVSSPKLKIFLNPCFLFCEIS